MAHNLDIRGTGSLMNAIYRQSAQPEPEVGMGCTILMWSDRHAATIVLVSQDKKRIWVERDHATRTDNNGMSESQFYTYTPARNGASDYYTLRKNGRWVRRGEDMHTGQAVSIGQRREYHDYSF